MSNRRRGHGEGSITQRTDGRWMARADLGWRNGRRVRKCFYGPTREDVRRKLTQALADLQNGASPVADERLTVGKFLESWLENSARPRVRPSTFHAYESKARVHILPELGRVRLTQLTPQRLEAFFNHKAQSGLSAQSVQHLRSVLRAALNDAVRWSLAPRNAASLTDGPRVPQHEAPTISPEDARSILEAVKGDRWEALYVTALASGLRQGELLGLRWQDIALEANTLSVGGSLQRVDGHFERVEPKTRRSRRTLALPSFAVAALRTHKVRQIEERLKAGAMWQDSQLVFTGPTGAPHHGPNVTLRFQALLRQAGLPRIRFHDLRHACGSLLVALGVHPRVVMETLGHSNITTTMNVYAHVVPSLQREAADRLDTLLAGSQSS